MKKIMMKTTINTRVLVESKLMEWKLIKISIHKIRVGYSRPSVFQIGCSIRGVVRFESQNRFPIYANTSKQS